jgi:hypothetical protein
MPTLEKADGREVDAALRWRHPQLPEPHLLPWTELPALMLDGEVPWLVAPVERDPLTTAGGRAVLPRREIRRLRRLAAFDVPFQRLASAHELDRGGAVAPLLPGLQNGPRTCTDAVARAVVGPQPVHPAVRRAGRTLDAAMARRKSLAGVVASLMDPIVFGVVGVPDVTQGELALWYPLAAWRW